MSPLKEEDTIKKKTQRKRTIKESSESEDEIPSNVINNGKRRRIYVDENSLN